MYCTTVTYNSKSYFEMTELRNKVLREPLGLVLTKEELEKENQDIFIAGIKNEKIICCCILSTIDFSLVKLRQMAVHPDFQGKNYGMNLLKYTEKIAQEKGFTSILLHARESAVNFYLKAGYITSGDNFTEVGILHKKMTKNI